MWERRASSCFSFEIGSKEKWGPTTRAGNGLEVWILKAFEAAVDLTFSSYGHAANSPEVNNLVARSTALIFLLCSVYL